MKIDLWSKKTGGKGYVKLGTVEVPDNFGPIYYLPVKTQMRVGNSEDLYTTPSSPLTPVREFIRQGGLGNRLDKENVRYVEV